MMISRRLDPTIIDHTYVYPSYVSADQITLEDQPMSDPGEYTVTLTRGDLLDLLRRMDAQAARDAEDGV